jgi:hypothetical protein
METNLKSPLTERRSYGFPKSAWGSKLSDADAKTGLNHYHLDEHLGDAEPGSIPLMILYKPDL